MGFSSGIGILSGQQLEGIDILRGEYVAQREVVAAARDLVQPDRRAIGIDALRRVGVEGALADVGSIGSKQRISGHEAFDDTARRWICREWDALLRPRNQDIAVDAASNLLLAAVG